MELWIRSKGRSRLVKASNVYYYGNTIESDGGLLGDYATEERCLEIIDEIQKLLLSANPKEAFILADCRNKCEFPHLVNIINYSRESKFIAYDGEDGTNFQLIQPSVLVYEMPKE